jgi:hypothetical protein
MDTKDSLWLDAFITDELREGSYRRDRIKRYWVGDSPVVSEMSRYYQEIGDDLGRRERMAEAMYDV